MANKRFLTGLIGRNIGKSRSPSLHEREADAQGLRLVYSLFDFAELDLSERDLPRMLEALELAGFAGVNVTHPYKQAIIEHLDALSSEAKQVGAVNTVAFRGGRKHGYNTDVSGFEAAFRQSFGSVALNDVVQIGAGGAGSATACALLDLGVRRLTVYDSDLQRADALIGRMATHFDPRRLVLGANLAESLLTSDGVVNATPMGMTEYPGMPVPEDSLREEMWVADIVYFPLETALLAAARHAGCHVMDGGGMAVRQAARAFEIFTGYPADADRMAKTFLERGI
jgi:quinate/shikimate dehydrogenase (NAD+)